MGRPIADFAEELQALSNNISNQVRSIALGLIALIWALLTGMRDSGITLLASERRELLWVALVAVGALVVDYLQYAFGYSYTLHILRAAERERRAEATYNTSAPLYRARTACFALKQVAVVLGAAWMGSIIIRLLF